MRLDPCGPVQVPSWPNAQALPDLAAVHAPHAVVAACRSPQGSQVRAGIRFRVALGPEVVEGQHAGKEPLALFRRAVADQCGADGIDAEVLDTRCVAGGQFLAEDGLLYQRPTRTAMLARPTRRCPAACVEDAMPPRSLFAGDQAMGARCRADVSGHRIPEKGAHLLANVSSGKSAESATDDCGMTFTSVMASNEVRGCSWAPAC